MFEVGKTYAIKMWEPGRDSDDRGSITTYPNLEALEVSLPLIKFKSPSLVDAADIIINTNSLAFISAQEQRTR